MMENRCVICNDIIPEGLMICPNCEHTQIKIGMILQSSGATEKEVKEAYESLEEKQ